MYSHDHENLNILIIKFVDFFKKFLVFEVIILVITKMSMDIVEDDRMDEEIPNNLSNM